MNRVARAMLWGALTLGAFSMFGCSLINGAVGSDNNNLYSLSVTGSDQYGAGNVTQPIYPAFSPGQTEYLLMVDNSVYFLHAHATADDGAAKVNIIGDGVEIGVGDYPIEVRVTAENSDKRSYNIHAISVSTDSANIGTLVVTNHTGAAIDHLYVAYTTADWGSDRLSEPLADGASVTLTSTPMGVYDVAATTGTGGIYEGEVIVWSSYYQDSAPGLGKNALVWKNKTTSYSVGPL